jgi:hypothetical protein
MLRILFFQLKPADFGPIYPETDLTRFPVEPWNTFSNLIFLLIILYWWRKTKLDIRKFPLVVTALPILLIGFVGGTVFHATRMHNIWLILDFMPIFILVIAAALYFWYRIVNNIIIGAVLTCVPFLLTYLLRLSLDLPPDFHITAGYVSCAVMILLPAVLHSGFNKWRHVMQLVFTVLCFIIAISCRQFDFTIGTKIFPMGLHFLWHIFGGLSAFFLIDYIYRSDLDLNLLHSAQNTLKQSKRPVKDIKA